MSVSEVGYEGVGCCVVLVLLVGYALYVGYALGNGSEFVGSNSEFVDACSARCNESYLVDDAGYGFVDVGYHRVGVNGMV